MGNRLRDARLRRGFSERTVCARANIARGTLIKIEMGNPGVAMGHYVQVLRVLGLEDDLVPVAADDVVGRRLQDAKLPHRERAPKRKKVSKDSEVPSHSLESSKLLLILDSKDVRPAPDSDESN